jgi:hypothetical protein
VIDADPAARVIEVTAEEYYGVPPGLPNYLRNYLTSIGQIDLLF